MDGGSQEYTVANIICKTKQMYVQKSVVVWLRPRVTNSSLEMVVVSSKYRLKNN